MDALILQRCEYFTSFRERSIRNVFFFSFFLNARVGSLRPFRMLTDGKNCLNSRRTVYCIMHGTFLAEITTVKVREQYEWNRIHRRWPSGNV